GFHDRRQQDHVDRSPHTTPRARSAPTRQTGGSRMLLDRHSGRSTIETIHEVRLKQFCARFHRWVEQSQSTRELKTSRRPPPRHPRGVLLFPPPQAARKGPHGGPARGKTPPDPPRTGDGATGRGRASCPREL